MKMTSESRPVAGGVKLGRHWRYQARQWTGLCLAVAACWLTTAARLHAEEQPIEPKEVQLDRDISYAEDVLPILKKNCIACHNATVKEGQLSLESPAAMLTGGDSGASIEPGDPEASFLYLVASRQSEPVMPPLPNKMNAHKLTGEEVSKLKRWIEQGAQGDPSAMRRVVQWSGVPANLQPIYALELFPSEDQFAVGRGSRVEVISLTDPTRKTGLIDPELEDRAHRDFVNAIAVHPSGVWLATAGYRTVKLWQQVTPPALQMLPPGKEIVALQTSPNAQRFVLATADGNLFSGSQQHLSLLKQGLEGITAVAVDDAGARLAVARGTEIQLLSVENETLSETVISGEAESPVQSFMFVQGTLWAGHADGVIRPWTQPEGAAALQTSAETMNKHTVAVTKLQPVAGEETSLLSVDASGVVVVWDTAARTPRLDWACGGELTGVAYLAAQKKLAAVHKDGRVTVWNDQKKQDREFKQSAALLRQSQLAEQEVTIAKALSAHAQTLKTETDKDLADRKGALEKAQKGLKEAEEAHMKTVAPRDEAQKQLEAIKQEIAAEGESDERKKKLEAATKTLDEKQKPFAEAEQNLSRARKTLELEEISVSKAEAVLANVVAQGEQTAAQVKQQEEALKAAQERLTQAPLQARGVRFVNAGQLQILTAEGGVEDWSLAEGTALRSNLLGEPTGTQQWFPLADGVMAVLRENQEVQRHHFHPEWRLHSRLGTPGGIVDVTESEFYDRVTSLAFSPDGRLLATGGGDPSRDGELLIWDWQAGQIERRLADAHSDVVLCLQFSRDGSRLLSGAADKFVKIFDVSTGEFVMAFEGHTEHVLGVAWTADALTVASGSADKSIKIWSTQDGSQKRTISNSTKQVTGLEFVGTSDNLVSSCGDKNVRMFQASSGRNYRNLAGAENYLYAVAVTSNEDYVLGGGQAGIVRIWNGKTGQLLHSLAP